MSDSETLRLLHGQLEDDYRFILKCASRHTDMRLRAERAAGSEMASMALAYLIHTLYTAVESYFLRVARHFENNLDDSAWHHELIDRMRIEVPGIRPAACRTVRAVPCYTASATMDEELLDWLDDSDDPSLRYRILRELQDQDDQDPRVQACRAEIPASPAVRGLLDSMHTDGYWLQAHPKTGCETGAGVEYGAFATTHFCLSYLAELGLDRSHPQVARAAERYLGLQGDSGDWTEAGWYERLSCLIGYNVRTFVRLGYRNDPRLTRAVELLLSTERDDGGYLCGIHDRRYKTKQAKSCIRGSVKALLAFAELPELYGHPRVARLVGYFLDRGGIFKSTDARTLVNADMERPSYPITWRANAWEILYVLARMGHGDDPRLDRAWRHLESLRDAGGRWVLSWSPVQCPWKVGKRGQANRWLSFYALAAVRLRSRRTRFSGSGPT